ncbi:polysaccharide pyruvyl transferase family protein [Rhodanobacter umsongensis]|uniref:Polysaccharide pyruvyl transferase family protein n=1 Tax=Rhodanobacter umsongensis TaxID=633153 RepID=A0ABW0JGJ3_9GAMM
MNNFGDDLFGVVCSAAARNYWDGDPRLVGPAIRDVDARYTMPSWYPTSIYGALGPLGRASRFYSFVRGLSDSDVMVMGGGSIIGGPPTSTFRQKMMISARRAGKLQLAAVGVSIGPIDNAELEDSVADFIGCFDYIAVRDKRSYDLAVEIGDAKKTHHGRDLAGLLPLIAAVSPNARGLAEQRGSSPIRLGVALCNYEVTDSNYAAPAKQDLLSSLTCELVQLAALRPLQVDIFSLNEHPVHGDYALSSALEQNLLERGVVARVRRYRDRSPLSMVQAIGECDAFISARLHGAIVAYLQGMPFAIVDYHPKCNDFADEIGLPSTLRITADGGDVSAAIGDALSSMLNSGNGPTLSREIYSQQAQDIFRCAPWSAASMVQRSARGTATRPTDPRPS